MAKPPTRRPIPPTAFRSRAPETAEDFQTLRRYLDQLVQWTDAAISAAVAAGGGGPGGPAEELATTGAPVNVGDADPPVQGDVLTAVDATHAVWRVPGLKYDPAVKFWTTSTGAATIEPNTWGFVEQPTVPPFTGPIVIYVVSSLSAPPVDSRFGLYVGADVTSPVEVHLIGTSRIMAPDGTLATTVTLHARAYYQWILYHEGGEALWGLVSDTAGVARSIAVTGSVPVELSGTAPTAGQVVKATSPTAAGWGSVTKADVGLGNVTNDAQLKRAGNDWPAFPPKIPLTSGDRFLIENAASSYAKAITTIDDIKTFASGGGAAWSVAANINPLHWYRADTTLQSGGLVDSITDVGRTAKNFTAAGGNRCATAVDSNSRTYLNVSNSFYQAGAAADWIFLHDGTPWTFCAVIQKTALGANVEALLSSMVWSSGGVGFICARGTAGNSSVSSPTPVHTWDCGIFATGSNPTVFYLNYATSVPYTGVLILTVVHVGYAILQSTQQFSGNPISQSYPRTGYFWQNGICRASQTSPLQRQYSSANPNGPMTLGKYVDGANPITARVYEVLFENRAITERDVQEYHRDAAVRYSVAL